jgi:hypothetical protein
MHDIGQFKEKVLVCNKMYATYRSWLSGELLAIEIYDAEQSVQSRHLPARNGLKKHQTDTLDRVLEDKRRTLQEMVKICGIKEITCLLSSCRY